MSIEYIKQIREQEELAERIRQDGVVESKRIINSANEEAAALIKSAQIEAEELYKETLEKTAVLSKDDYDRIIHQAKTEVRLLKEGAEKKMDSAAALIAEWVVSEWQS